MTDRLKAAMLGGVASAVVAVMSGSPAMAAAAAPAPVAADDGNGEIIVTARKVAENVQNISTTIAVLSNKQLDAAGINSLENIEGQVPGLQFGYSGFNGAQLGLRGISSQRSYTGDEAAVAVHIDGIYQPQSSQALARLFDIERIEVLKGPQGTLYGRNANAGVINVVTKAPTDRFEGYGQLSYGSFQTKRGEGAINVPLNADNEIRVSGSFGTGNGYIHNLSSGPGLPKTVGKEDFWGGRIRYHGQWGDTLTAQAGFQMIDDRSTRDQAQTYSSLPRYSAYFDSPTNSRRKDYNYFFQLDDDLGAVGIRSLTGGSAFTNHLRSDFNIDNPTSLDNHGANSGWTISEELSIFGKNSRVIDWRLGLFYQHSYVEETRRAIGPVDGYYIYQDLLYSQKGDAYAGFGDVTWHFTPQLSLNVGLRYSYETKQGHQDETHSEDALGPGSGAPPGAGGPLDCSVAYTPFSPPFPACRSVDTKKFGWHGLTGRAGIDFKPRDGLLVYANYGRGFRSGAVGGVIGTDNFFDAIFGGPGTFGLVKLDEEKVDNFEAGFKGDFLDRALTVDLSAFYARFKNMLFTIADPNTFRQVDGNLGSADVYGSDLMIVLRPAQRFNLTFNGEYLHTKVKDVPPPSFFAGVPAILEGNKLPRAPKFSASVSGDYTIPVGDAGSVELFAQYTYKGRHYFDLSNLRQQKGYGLVNLSARFESANKRWYVFVNGDNVFNKYYLLDGGPTITNPNASSRQRPAVPGTFEVGGGIHF